MKAVTYISLLLFAYGFTAQAMENNNLKDIHFCSKNYSKFNTTLEQDVPYHAIKAIYVNHPAFTGPIGEIEYKDALLNNSETYIDYLSVKKEFSGKGIGSELFIKALEQIKQQDKKFVSWYALDSAKFYVPFGAKVTEKPTKGPFNKQYSAHMEFNFDLDGDPRTNKTEFKMRKRSFDTDFASCNIYEGETIVASFLRETTDDEN